jgi:signal transduction histidine kinase
LVVLKGADEGRQFELNDAIVGIGRDATNRIRLHDTEVSRRHAELRRDEEGYRVHDLGSANGTWVNNEKVADVPLSPGDRIAIGQTLLVYSPDPTKSMVRGELAQKISMIARGDVEIAPSIVRTIHETAGSQILSDPNRTSPWLQNQLANLAIIYEAAQAVSHILDVPQLLQRLLELVFRSIPADRGCVMLTGDNGDPKPGAVHWRKPDHDQQLLLSRTIVDHVLKEKQGVLLSDAAADDRFANGGSIVRFGIREVICVPMKGRHETLGVLYLDTQITTREAVQNPTGGKFTADHLALAIAIAHQAALAVEETRYHQAMLQAERMAAIGHTIAALSHHIKNILQGLRSGNEILKMGLDQKNDKLIHQGYRVSEKNQGKIYDLVMDMLNFSKERVPSVEPTDVNDLVNDVVELLTPKSQEMGIVLEKALSPQLPVIPIDPEGIHRALLNLVGNALDAVEGRPEAKVTVGTRLDDTFVRIVILDNGVGIPAEKLGDLFKPFMSTKGSRGTGLGLPVSQKIVREHGGEILVQSQANAGSKFTIKLPMKSPFVTDPSSATGFEIPTAPPEAD